MAMTHKVKLGKEVMEFQYPYTLDGRKPDRPTVFPQLHTIFVVRLVKFDLQMDATAESTIEIFKEIRSYD